MSTKNVVVASKMLEVIETVGGEVTLQILDTFANTDPDDQRVA
jgi:hypothetical protein